MTSYIRVSPATTKTRKEAVKTLRVLLDSHVPRKIAFRQVQKQLQSMHLPHSRDTIYRWAREFNISTK